jgi:hypothetical protein
LDDANENWALGASENWALCANMNIGLKLVPMKIGFWVVPMDIGLWGPMKIRLNWVP